MLLASIVQLYTELLSKMSVLITGVTPQKQLGLELDFV